jgi:tetratricopeptide (TPR) repeat protein
MMIVSAKAEGMNEGVDFYSKRQEGSKGTLASNENIDKAIEQFSTALLSPESEKDAALYLLKSYYYKAEFAVQDKDEKKKIFNEGKVLGEKYIEKYPTSAEFRYWYLVNLGSWAQVYGILTAAREGVSDLMRTHSEKIIELDPEYQNGGGYFMLGAVHFKSPYIPFLLSWPDNDDAIKYLQLSVDTGNAEMNQKNYLARALSKDGQDKKARALLEEVLNTKPSTATLVEDLDDIKEARQLLEEL